MSKTVLEIIPTNCRDIMKTQDVSKMDHWIWFPQVDYIPKIYVNVIARKRSRPLKQLPINLFLSLFGRLFYYKRSRKTSSFPISVVFAQLNTNAIDLEPN